MATVAPVTRRPQVIGLALAYLGWSVLSRRWHRSWGATPYEAVESLPGDELVPRADLRTTRAIDIDVAPTEAWPWLVQMGQGRGGLYTYEWIENLLGAKIHNLDRIDPDLQQLEVGNSIRLTPEVYLGRIPGQSYEVRQIAPEHALVLLQRLPTGGLTSWSFILRSSGATRTRLVVRGRRSAPASLAEAIARQIELVLLEPGYFIMERGMLRGIKHRAETLAGRHEGSDLPARPRADRPGRDRHRATRRGGVRRRRRRSQRAPLQLAARER